jgi:hypothetical protein
MGFKETQVQQLPKWISGADHTGHSEGVAFEQSFGATKDAELDLLKQAAKVRWPQSGPDDALTLMGRDRVLLQAPIESNSDYRLRLTNAPDLWLWGGTKTGIIDRFAPYGYDATTCHIYNNNEIVWDGNALFYTRVFGLLDYVYWTVDGLWSDPGNYDDGALWDADMTVADADYLRKSIRAWKSEWAYPVVLGLVLGNAPAGDGFWDTIGFYDDGGFWTDIDLYASAGGASVGVATDSYADTTTTSSAGSDDPHENMPPFIALHFIIKT